MSLSSVRRTICKNSKAKSSGGDIWEQTAGRVSPSPVKLCRSLQASRRKQEAGGRAGISCQRGSEK